MTTYFSKRALHAFAATAVVCALLASSLTANAALAWTQRASSTTVNLYDVAVKGSTLIAVGDSGIIRRSTDGGLNWNSVPSGTEQQLRDVDFASNGDGSLYAVGSFGTVIKSSNEGASWSAVTVGSAETFESVAVVDGQNIAIGGANGTLLTTTDWGQTWQLRQLGSTRKVTAVESRSSAALILAFLDNGVPMRSENFGATWAEGSMTGFDNMLDIEMLNSSIAYASGLSGRVVKTTNGGISWTDTATPASVSTEALHDIALHDSTNLMVVGTSGTIISTNDSGNTWTKETLSIGNNLFGIAAVNNSYTKHAVVASSGVIITSDLAPTLAPSAPTNLMAAGVSANTNYSTNSATPSISWTASVKGSADIAGYQVKIDSGTFFSVGIVTQYTLPSLTNGLHTIRVRAIDTAGTASDEAIVSFTVDTVAPSVSAPTPTASSIGATTAFTITATDNGSYVNYCRLFVNGAEQGSMDLKSAQQNTYGRSYYFATAGSFALTARCVDNAGNASTGAATTINLNDDGSRGSTPADTTPSAALSYLSSNPSQGVADGATNVYVTVTVRNAAGIALANKSVSLVTSRPQTDSITTIASVTNDVGQASFYVRSSTVGVSQLTAVIGGSTVASAGLTFGTQQSPVIPGQPTPGALIKLACPPSADVNHICRAVYFVSQGKRHAFPNSKVYFSWYPDFSNVQTVSAETMASLMLGKNMVYHPGVKMVKFVTNPRVYAVGKGGLLRGVTSEAVAKGL